MVKHHSVVIPSFKLIRLQYHQLFRFVNVLLVVLLNTAIAPVELTTFDPSAFFAAVLQRFPRLSG
jgi:hypothetical protein